MDRPYGLLAEFDSPRSVVDAAIEVRHAGYQRWDAYTPFAVHGLDQAMDLKPSRLPWLVLAMGLTGASLGFVLQYWVSVVAYPTVVSGKPHDSWQAFVPITFECGVLLGALAAVLGMFFICRLPRWYHPLFTSERFERATDDGFFIAIEREDPRYDEDETRRLLEGLGATHVELIMEER